MKFLQCIHCNTLTWDQIWKAPHFAISNFQEIFSCWCHSCLWCPPDHSGNRWTNVTTYFAGQVISLLQLMFSFDHNFSLECGKEFIIVDRDW